MLQQLNNKAEFSRGFTLVELMIIIAVIAIIAAVALPSYNSSVLKSKRAMGKAELLEVLALQEQYFINNKAYATTLTGLGYAANPYYIDGQGEQTTTGNAIYQIVLASPTTTSFTLQAVPQNAQTNDSDCGTLTLTNTGLKSADNLGIACW